ncbi:MAG: hypothetical protein U9Q03_00060 [Patescibacteria group bacterium]|nr:hypothetical protein [Patescibacteria group bacterium]
MNNGNKTPRAKIKTFLIYAFYIVIFGFFIHSALFGAGEDWVEEYGLLVIVLGGIVYMLDMSLRNHIDGRFEELKAELKKQVQG